MDGSKGEASVSSFSGDARKCRCLGGSPLPVLDEYRAEAVCGNAMNFGSCAVVLLCGLVCFGAATNADSPSDDCGR